LVCMGRGIYLRATTTSNQEYGRKVNDGRNIQTKNPNQGKSRRLEENNPVFLKIKKKGTDRRKIGTRTQKPGPAKKRPTTLG